MGVQCHVVPRRPGSGSGYNYATIGGDILFISDAPAADGDAWLLDGATTTASDLEVRIALKGLEPLLLRFDKSEEAADFKHDIDDAIEKSMDTKRQEEQLFQKRRKKRRDYLVKWQGVEMLEDAERRVGAGAAVCVQGSVVSITGLPEQSLLLRFPNDRCAQDWAEQLLALMGLPILTKEFGGSPSSPRTPTSPRQPCSPGSSCPRRPKNYSQQGEEGSLG